MTMKDMAKRLAALEAEVRTLREELDAVKPGPRSILDLYGKYANDPEFAEAERLGREWREEENRKSLEEFDREEAEARRKTAKGNGRKPRKSNAGR